MDDYGDYTALVGYLIQQDAKQLGKHIEQELADNPVTIRERVSWWWERKTGKTAKKTAKFEALITNYYKGAK